MKRFFEEIKFIVNPFEQVVLVLVNEIKYNSIILQCQEFFFYFFQLGFFRVQLGIYFSPWNLFLPADAVPAVTKDRVFANGKLLSRL